ncbi:hypothetical protein [Auraticoccus monumenti]|uniref:Uncharacterized protein n=1 Tax=Auraticoccus monumenti TaxID=675864 RepID=A0A1G7CRW3_9ACTN|nr:hypothetical protein [Auraticoccus monumenti]SDE42092.1 hypothetical protein SAMN04489747_3360 [Auraticoccus monumenti]
MTKPFVILLRNHQAGGRAAIDLFTRTAAAQRDRSYGAELERLLAEAREDLAFNERVMRRLGVPPFRALVVAARVGERLGRLKPNGHLVRRAPLSDVIELEGLIATVSVKVAGWEAAQVAGELLEGELAELEGLIQRGHSQTERLTEMHRTAAADVLGARRS